MIAALAFVASLLGCTAQQARVANAVLSGVACGVAAAQETPCTPQAVLDALARDGAAQQAKIEAVVPQAAAVDPVMARTLVEQLARNSAANEALTRALLDLATRQPLPAFPLEGPMPALPPPVAPARAVTLPVKDPTAPTE